MGPVRTEHRTGAELGSFTSFSVSCLKCVCSDAGELGSVLLSETRLSACAPNMAQVHT